MGIEDDLARMAGGETLGSVLGVFAVGDRIALRDSVWDLLQEESPAGIEHIPRDTSGFPIREVRFGTAVAVSSRDEHNVVIVRHDDGQKRRWNAQAVMKWEDWLWMTIKNAPKTIGCHDCGDCGYREGDPNRGLCHCQQHVDYDKTDGDFAARRRKSRGNDDG